MRGPVESSAGARRLLMREICQTPARSGHPLADLWLTYADSAPRTGRPGPLLGKNGAQLRAQLASLAANSTSASRRRAR